MFVDLLCELEKLCMETMIGLQLLDPNVSCDTKYRIISQTIDGHCFRIAD